MAEVFGIDVSHHNGKICWEQVAHHKKFAIMKAQYEAKSHHIDEQFEYNYHEAGKYGIARGVYIYVARHSVEDPVADAKALLAKLKDRKLEYGIWLDLEDASVRGIGKDKWNQIIYTYANIFRAAGYYVGIYCNKDWYDHVLDSAYLAKDFDFWIARYPKGDSGMYNSVSSLKPSRYAAAWQYSSKGNVPGIKTHVDLNVDFDGVINLMARDGATLKTNRDVAQEVIAGKWGTATSNPSRKHMLEAAGYDYGEVQTIVNQLLKKK